MHYTQINHSLLWPRLGGIVAYLGGGSWVGHGTIGDGVTVRFRGQHICAGRCVQNARLQCYATAVTAIVTRATHCCVGLSRVHDSWKAERERERGSQSECYQILYIDRRTLGNIIVPGQNHLFYDANYSVFIISIPLLLSFNV